MLLQIALVVGAGLLILARPIPFVLGKSVNFDFTVRLVLIAFGAGAFLAFSVIPSLAMAWGFSEHDGKLDDHLIVDPNEILVGQVVGVLLGALWAVKGYIDALRGD
jgi:hypothetical protein